VTTLVLVALLSGCATVRSQAVPVQEEELVDALDVQLQMAEALVRSGRHARALNMVGSLRAEGHDSVRLDQVHAAACTGQELYDEAIGLLTPLRHWPSAESQRLLGLAYAGAERADEAVVAFDRAVRRSRNNDDTGQRASLHNNLGFALMTASRPLDAVASFRKAIALDPTSGRSRNNLGFALGAIGRDDDALASFQAAARLDPRSSLHESQADALYNLGLAQDLRGDTAAARDSYAAALEAWPDHVAASQALAESDPDGPEQEEAP